MTNEAKERAIRWLTEEVRSLRLAPNVNGCEPDNWAESLEVMETCLELVRGCNQVANKSQFGCNPLTMEQLREMGGQPVWIQNIEEPDKSQWRLCHWDRGKYLVLQGISVKGYLLEEYGESWLAYAYPPAHIDMGAWSGCVCTTSDKSCCTCVSMNCHTCIRQSEYKRGRYCSACGRPLTEEARDELEKRLRG